MKCPRHYLKHAISCTLVEISPSEMVSRADIVQYGTTVRKGNSYVRDRPTQARVMKISSTVRPGSKSTERDLIKMLTCGTASVSMNASSHRPDATTRPTWVHNNGNAEGQIRFIAIRRRCDVDSIEVSVLVNHGKINQSAPR